MLNNRTSAAALDSHCMIAAVVIYQRKHHNNEHDEHQCYSRAEVVVVQGGYEVRREEGPFVHGPPIQEFKSRWLHVIECRKSWKSYQKKNLPSESSSPKHI